MNNADPLKNIIVVLTQPSHPGNIGATARAMKTMGLRALRLVRPRCFPHADADARASGAIDILESARVHDTLVAAIADCTLAVATTARRCELAHDVADARTAMREAVSAAAIGPVALVFGNETSGVSNEEAGLCQVWASIPASAEYSSLNLAAAVQVFAYEARMATAAQTAPANSGFPFATSDEIEKLHQHFERTMTHTGFFDPANPRRLMTRLRRLFARTRLEAEEVNILRGFLNSVDKMRGRD